MKSLSISTLVALQANYCQSCFLSVRNSQKRALMSKSLHVMADGHLASDLGVHIFEA
jgi:hypothetical protein